MPKPFLDTNVLVYALASSDERSAIATVLLAEGAVISVQVLNEFVNVARRKLGKDWPSILQVLDDLAILLDPPVAITFDTHRAALDISRRHQLGIYDSLILGAATLAGCRIHYSEDMQHGLVVGGLTIINPFMAKA